MRQLDPLQIELTGASLIEASAGTGKTYTITTLFLRLLLERKVSIDQVLVVTFTIAATEELRIKLSDRLHLANQWVRYPETIDSSRDPTLATLIANANRDEALDLIGDAVARLDDLSVYTIDAMCLRLLQDFAFESRLPMRIDMIADDADIRIEVVRDYWRCVLGSGDDFQIDNLMAFAKSPQELLAKLNEVLRRRDARLVPNFDAEQVEQLALQVKQQYQQIIECWNNNGKRIKEVFADEAQVLKKTSYAPAPKERVMKWMKSQDHRLPANMPRGSFKLLTTTWMTAQTKTGQVTPTHPFFDLCDGFEARFNDYKKWQKVAAIVAARDYLVDAIDHYKSDRGLIHFEDMRTRLDRVLGSEDSAALGEKIRKLWPFALIDEFQDTDAEQFRIFSAIYDDQPQCGFFMIGDPKQAVYSWRGADVFTYMEAVSKTPQAYTLATNWRSSPRLVGAVNSMFENVDNAFVFDRIPFNPVAASKSNTNLELIRSGCEVAPMRFCLFEDAQNDAVAVACAADITRLLIEGHDGSATIGEKPVSPADIAVLVRSHAEASQMQNALRRFGVRTVSMPNQSVFQSVEAQELHQVLHAMAYPGREEALRAALVTNLLGYNSRDMELLLLEESRWDALVDNFINARELWLERGFMYALQILLADLGVASRLLQSVDGEQRITNLLQLSELLQIKAREIASHEELILWLKKQIDTGRPGEDALLLRLESDEGLVQIVTMHKSKGLEYPVVFIPFPMALNTSVNPQNDIVVYHDPQDNSPVIDIGSESVDDAKQQRQAEQLSEELRLLYVAVTRAKSACVLYCGEEKRGSASALKHLLHRSADKPDYAQIKSDLDSLVQRSGGSIEVVDMQIDSSVYLDTAGAAQSLTLSKYTTRINQRWGMNSYTGLLRGRDADLPDHDEMSEPADELPGDQTALPDKEEQLIASLPAGASTGQLLHEIFEYMDFTDTSDLGMLIENAMLHHGHLSSSQESQENDWASVIEKIVINSINADLDVKGELNLQRVENKNRLNEMEFFFSVSNLDPDSLQNTLAQYDQYHSAAVGLNFSAFEGLMQGFIDMVVRKDNRYYIVDYKSNWLGETLEHYSQSALTKAISSHRYNLQYLIYTVALHRYLGKRVADYNYESHFGGVYYLFVRGMRPQSNNGVWFDKPPFALIDALDNLMLPKLAVA